MQKQIHLYLRLRDFVNLWKQDRKKILHPYTKSIRQKRLLFLRGICTQENLIYQREFSLFSLLLLRSKFFLLWRSLRTRKEGHLGELEPLLNLGRTPQWKTQTELNSHRLRPVQVDCHLFAENISLKLKFGFQGPAS